MCNHEYKTDKKCPYPELYKKWRERKNTAEKLKGDINRSLREKIFPEHFLQYDLNLPYDSNSICLFHSKDLEWKRKNQFTKRFRELIDLLNWDDEVTNSSKMDFEDFIIVGNDPVSWGKSEFVARLDNLVFHKYVNFKNSQFLDYAYFSNVRFNSYSYFKNSEFHGGCKFEKGTIFHGSTNFQNCTFEDYCYFKKVEFKGSAYFDYCHFKNTSEFTDVIFTENQATVFDNIKVNKTLHYKNVVNIKRFFGHSVQFDINPEDLLGKIIFEDANLYRIEKKELEKLRALEKEDKVEIGKNCEKYRLQYEVILDTEKLDETLGKDLALAFTEFLRLSIKLDIDVEFESRNSILLVRYFDTTSEDSQPIWQQRIIDELDSFAEILENIESCRIMAMQEIDPERRIAFWDLFGRLYKFYLGLFGRLTEDLVFNEEFVKKLMGAIDLDNNRTEQFFRKTNSYINHLHLKIENKMEFQNNKFIADNINFNEYVNTTIDTDELSEEDLSLLNLIKEFTEGEKDKIDLYEHLLNLKKGKTTPETKAKSKKLLSKFLDSISTTSGKELTLALLQYLGSL